MLNRHNGNVVSEARVSIAVAEGLLLAIIDATITNPKDRRFARSPLLP